MPDRNQIVPPPAPLKEKRAKKVRSAVLAYPGDAFVAVGDVLSGTVSKKRPAAVVKRDKPAATRRKPAASRPKGKGKKRKRATHPEDVPSTVDADDIEQDTITDAVLEGINLFLHSSSHCFCAPLFNPP